MLLLRVLLQFFVANCPPLDDVEGMDLTTTHSPGCSACRQEQLLPFAFSMAFQPIVNVSDRSVFAYESLVRGVGQQSAVSVMSQLNATNLYSFDQACRVKSIELATQLRLADGPARLSINFIPNAVYRPEACIQTTVQAAARTGFPLDRLIFEVTEAEKIRDHAHLNEILRDYRKRGFSTAIDDFGAGYAGLNLLAKFQPDILKIDMELTRDIDSRPVSRTIISAVLMVCREVGIRPIAEGIETAAELKVLQDMGIELFQGHLFARPELEALPVPVFPDGSMSSMEHRKALAQ